MSTLAQARGEFAGALNSVDGVKYFETRPQAPRSGDTWLRWRAERDDNGAGGFDVTWSVAIITPPGESAADTWIDEHIDDLLSAIRPVAYVTGYVPANFGTDSSPILGLLITTNRE